MASILSKEQKKKKKEKFSLSELKVLGHDLLTSQAHVNNLPLLLTFVNPFSSPQYVLESLISIQSFFTPLLPDFPSGVPKSSLSSSQDDPDFIYRSWLRSKFDEFVRALIDVAVSSQSEQALREVVLDAIMDFVKVGIGGKFSPSIYRNLLSSIVYAEFGVDDVVLDLLATKYFNFIDVRYFTYISMEKLARTLESENISDKRGVSKADKDSPSKASMDRYIEKMHYILSHVHPIEASEENSGYEMLNETGIFFKEGNHKQGSAQKQTKNKHEDNFSSGHVLPAAEVAKKMKRKFSKAWVAFLRLPLPLHVYKEVLVTFHQAVIPHLSNPIMLCDFLTRSYDIGGVISVMALSSLFILLTQYGLEYPNFYEKLYALLDPSVFLAKHRSKFFELLDSCLKSPLLPAYLAASFTKRLSRLALTAPPSGALVITALIHNLLRRHPSINFLVHNEAIDDVAEEMTGEDHFDNEEPNPMKTSAMRSSLWEVDNLRHHYCPPVSRFVMSLENDLTVRAKTTEVAVKDFSAASYASIFGEELSRRVKQVPLAFYKTTPTSLFTESEFPGWSFTYNNDKHPLDTSDGNAKRPRIECSS